MRILILTNYFPPESLGGYERLCEYVTTNLMKRSHDVQVFSGRLVPPQAANFSPHVRATLTTHWDHRSDLLVERPLLANLRVELVNRRVLKEALTGLSPEVVFVWGMGAMTLGLVTVLRRFSIPILYFVGDDWLRYGSWTDSWAREILERPRLARLLSGLFSLNRQSKPRPPETFLFVSEFTRSRALELPEEYFEQLTCEFVTARDARDSSKVVGAAYNEELFRPRLEDKRWNWDITFVGRIVEGKGVSTLLDVAHHIPQARVRIVGPGHPMELCPENVQWLGQKSSSEVAAIYHGSDVVVFPTEPDSAEAFGIVPLEAMASGIPLVASPVAGPGEYLQHEVNCLLFKPGDSQSLGAALTRLAEEKALRDKLITGGLQTASNYTVKALTDKVEQELREVSRTSNSTGTT